MGDEEEDGDADPDAGGDADGEGEGEGGDLTSEVHDGHDGRLPSSLSTTNKKRSSDSSTYHNSSSSSTTVPVALRAHLLQVCIASMHQNGRDTHIRQAKVYGPRVSQTPTWFMATSEAGEGRAINIQKDENENIDSNNAADGDGENDSVGNGAFGTKKLEMQVLTGPSTVTFQQFNAIR